MTSPSRTRSSINLHRQHGAIGLWGVVTLLLAVLFTALAVDAGRLWMQRRQLQLVADIASIQAARQIGCDVVMANVIAAAQAAATANGFTGSLSASPNVVELGSVETVNGIRQFTADSSSEAVHVYATRTVPASLVAGGLFGGTVTLHAEAVSRADSSLAAFSAGSFALNFNSNHSAILNGLLGGMLGSSLNLSVLSYQGIADTQVTLNDLIAASGTVGDVDSFLNSSMTIGGLAGLTATAMTNSSTANATAIAGMQQIASAAVNNASISMGSLLNVTTPDTDAAGKVGINALSLIMAAAMIANGSNAISIPLAVNAAPVTSITGQVNITSPPVIAIGPPANGGNVCTSVQTAQVDAKVDVVVNIPTIIATAKVDLSLQVQIAQGSADLASITPQSDHTDVNIDVQTGIAKVLLGNSSGGNKGSISATLPFLGNKTIADLSMDIPVQPSNTQTLSFTVNHPVADDLPKTEAAHSQIGDSLANGLSGALVVTPAAVPGASAIISAIVGPVLTPLLQQIGSIFLDPLLELLGIRVGGMDVTLEGLQAHQEKPLII